MQPIAQCKWKDCDGNITVGDVHQIQAIVKAPHHVALISQCPTCQRAGKYVIERTIWEQLQTEPPQQQEEIDKEKVLVGAAIELDAIETADDLFALFSSYGPPLMEVQNHCTCYECLGKRYV